VELECGRIHEEERIRQPIPVEVLIDDLCRCGTLSFGGKKRD
jgi:hypothetical protein